MKKLSFITAIVLCLLVSCEKHSAATKLHADESGKTASIQTFKSLSDVQDQRLAYPLLNVDEQKELLLDHLEFCLTYFDFNSAQEELINYSIAKIDLIISEDPELSSVMAHIENSRKIDFSTMHENEIALIFTTVIDNDPDANYYISNGTLGSSGPVPLDDCNCSPNSNWCTIFPDSHVKCLTPACSKSRGCGTFMRFECKGKCTVVH